MKIPNSFKKGIKSTFYDKEILTYTTESDNSEGWVTNEATEDSSFTGNVRFDKLEELREEYGIKEDIAIAITTDYDISIGNVIGYQDKLYRIVSQIESDSHYLLLGEECSLQLKESMSA